MDETFHYYGLVSYTFGRYNANYSAGPGTAAEITFQAAIDVAQLATATSPFLHCTEVRPCSVQCFHQLAEAVRQRSAFSVAAQVLLTGFSE